VGELHRHVVLVLQDEVELRPPLGVARGPLGARRRGRGLDLFLPAAAQQRQREQSERERRGGRDDPAWLHDFTSVKSVSIRGLISPVPSCSGGWARYRRRALRR